MQPGDRCPDCGVAAGEYHERDCDIEQCPYCGGQLLSCDCRAKPPLDDRLPWSGVWPGVDACRAFGWYARLVPGRGWVACSPEDPEATEDLNRLHTQAVWDREQKRFRLPAKGVTDPEAEGW